MNRLVPAVAAALIALPFASARVQGDAAPAGGLQDRAAFERAWQHWSETPEGPEKEALALEVDRLAGQRYATVSRLYWHRDMESALEAADASGKPILALRMLGNLDQDLSCANSRLFRVVLYANAELSTYLREHFELVWTSERPVPRVTIDFGDGRVLERTITGNSAHFVLDRHGRPVDVLPGLYGPRLFREALEPARVVARQVSGLGDRDRFAILKEFHAVRLEQSDAFLGFEQRPPQPPLAPTLMAAEGRTLRKRAMELPDISALALGAFDSDQQIEIERRWQEWSVLARSVEQEVLDDASLVLFEALAPTDWSRPGQALPEASRRQLMQRFERELTVEGVANEHGLHAEVHRWFVDGSLARDLPGLQHAVYTRLFQTPASDPWLGLATPGVFSALPDDGLSVSGSYGR